MTKTCRGCEFLKTISTGSQIILICTKTRKWKHYGDECDIQHTKKLD